MTTLQQQLESVRGFAKILDDYMPRLQTIETNQAALLKEIAKSQTLSTSQAQSLATLEQRLQAIESNQVALLK